VYSETQKCHMKLFMPHAAACDVCSARETRFFLSPRIAVYLQRSQARVTLRRLAECLLSGVGAWTGFVESSIFGVADSRRDGVEKEKVGESGRLEEMQSDFAAAGAEKEKWGHNVSQAAVVDRRGYYQV